MNVYWSKCAGGRNFGDVLGPLLVQHFTGVDVEWAAAEEANLVVVGSILEHLPVGFSGTIAGIGKANAKTHFQLRQANVLALRGPVTLKSVWLEKGVRPLLADPGLVAPDLLPEQPKQIHKLGIVRHYLDTQTPIPDGAFVIDVTNPVLQVIAEIGSCERIVSSSLHGLIVADAFNIPRQWARFDKVQGRGLKFEDYAASFGMSIEPDEWMSPPQMSVAMKQERLREILSCLADSPS